MQGQSLFSGNSNPFCLYFVHPRDVLTLVLSLTYNIAVDNYRPSHLPTVQLFEDGDLHSCIDSERRNIFEQEIGMGFENSFKDLENGFSLFHWC